MAQSDLLVASWCKSVKSLPANYIMPPELRTTDFSVSKDIPVLDLEQEAGHGRSSLIQQIIKAGEEFGAFQVRYAIRDNFPINTCKAKFLNFRGSVH